MVGKMTEIGREAVLHGARSDRRPLPFNSKRLTRVYVQAIARPLELPTWGSAAETRQIIDGKLSDDGREPINVQVINVQVIIVKDQDGAESVSLTDANRVFLDPVPVGSST